MTQPDSPITFDASKSPDVIVIGGGIVGCTIALRLARRGITPLVLERSVPGAEASTVAAGILSPLIEHGHQSPATRLGIASREEHAILARELREEHDIDVGFRRCGAAIVALDDDELALLDARLGSLRALGAEFTRLDAREARREHPDLSEETRGLLDLPQEAQVEPASLMRAVAIAARRAGARFQTGSPVREVVVERDRVVGVRTDADILRAANVVVAAGSWTSLIGGLPAALATVRPIRGQVLTCELRPPLGPRVLFGAGGYVVPRADGRVLCGATMEDVGFAKEVTLGGITELGVRATRLVPRLSQAALLGHAVSFRPATPDDLPLIGSAGPEGLFVAAGHHRNGILLAPRTATLITAAILGDALPEDAAAFSPLRLLNKAAS